MNSPTAPQPLPVKSPRDTASPGEGQSNSFFPLWAWLISRIVCAGAMFTGAWLFPIEGVYDLRRVNIQAGPQDNLRQFFQDYARNFRDPKVFGKQPMVGITAGGRDAWLRPLFHWDSVWWLSVVEVGYIANPTLQAEQNVVFFPLFPICIRTLTLLGIPTLLAAILVTNVCMLATVYLLYDFVRKRSGTAVARWTIILWLTFPTALFGVVPYSEGLMALMTILSIRALIQGSYIACGAWSGIASALRNQGVILGGALLLPWFRGPARTRAFLGLGLSGLGLGAYMFYLYLRFGDPLLFVSIQKAWRPKLGTGTPVDWILQLVTGSLHSLSLCLASETRPILRYSGRLLDPWLAWWVIAWIPSVKRLHPGLLLTSVVMILLPLSTGTVASLGRYAWVILPVFIVMGESLARSHWKWAIVLISTVGLLWQSFLFGGGWEVI